MKNQYIKPVAFVFEVETESIMQASQFRLGRNAGAQRLGDDDEIDAAAYRSSLWE